MIYDAEQNILDDIREKLPNSSILLMPPNSFCKKIKNALQQKEITNNSGHDANPPDFYSESLNIMFDAMRVNDSEVKKTYNPAYISERKMQEELEKALAAQGVENISGKLICISPDHGSDEIHKMKYYQKNMKRVINEHLSSKGHPDKIRDIWQTEHSSISRKGLVICDETENYFQGKCFPVPNSEKWMFYSTAIPPVLYKPWMDKNVMDPVYKSNCDFLVWYMPYKRSPIAQDFDPFFPELVILDTRYPPQYYINYNYSELTRM